MTKPHVLVTIKGLGLGGAERLLANSLPYLDRTRFEYSLANLCPEHASLEEPFARAGIPIHRIRLSPLRLPLATAQLASLIKRERVDLIHAHLPLAGVVARLAGAATGTPVVYTEHGPLGRYNPITAFASKLTFRLNSAVTAISASVRDDLGRAYQLSSESIHLIENQVSVPSYSSEERQRHRRSLREQLGLPQSSFIFGTVASFRPQKRLDLLVSAFDLQFRDRGETALVLVGDGVTMPEVRGVAESSPACGRIKFLGAAFSPAPLMAAFDVFVMSSEHEGQPLALLEALALGIPAIATPVGGVPDLIRPQVNGLLAENCTIQAIGGAMKALADNAVLRSSLSRNAREWTATRPSIRQNVERVETLYLKTLSAAS